MWTIIRHFFDPKFRPEEPNLKVIVSQERERERGSIVCPTFPSLFDWIEPLFVPSALQRSDTPCRFPDSVHCFVNVFSSTTTTTRIAVFAPFKKSFESPSNDSGKMRRRRRRLSLSSKLIRKLATILLFAALEYKITQDMGSCCGTVVKVDAFFTEDLGSNLVIASFGSFTKRWLKTKNITSALC